MCMCIRDYASTCTTTHVHVRKRVHQRVHVSVLIHLSIHICIIHTYAQAQHFYTAYTRYNGNFPNLNARTNKTSFTPAYICVDKIKYSFMRPCHCL